MRHEAIYALYPQVISIDEGTGAFDKDGNKIEVDENAVQAKARELEMAELKAEQDKNEALASAHAKLAAIGLTADEIAAITGVK